MKVSMPEILPVALVATLSVLACGYETASSVQIADARERSDGNHLGQSPREFAAVAGARFERVEEALVSLRSEGMLASEDDWHEIEEVRTRVHEGLLTLRTEERDSWTEVRDQVVRDLRVLEQRLEDLTGTEVGV